MVGIFGTRSDCLSVARWWAAVRDQVGRCGVFTDAFGGVARPRFPAAGGVPPAVVPARQAALADAVRIEVHPLGDAEDACRQYDEDGYEVTDRLREFLTAWGGLTVTWKWRGSGEVLTTSVEPTPESTRATPRNLGIFGP